VRQKSTSSIALVGLLVDRVTDSLLGARTLDLALAGEVDVGVGAGGDEAEDDKVSCFGTGQYKMMTRN